MRLRQRFLLGLGLCSAIACTGSLDSPTRPLGAGGGAGGTPGAGPGAMPGTSTPTGEAPAGIGTQVFELCQDDQEKPGPRLLRLLTRREYANTIEDLLFLASPDVASLPLDAR